MELYSRPLSPGARLKLTEFIQAYIESMVVAEVDERAEIAKKKAIEALNTDIDILVFVTTLMTLYQAASFVSDIIKGKLTSKEVAEQVVDIAERARRADKLFRPGGKENDRN